MKVKLWGTRGSLATPGPGTIRYGGNTSCVSVEGENGTLLVLDAGTGIRALGRSLPLDLKRVHILLTHLHMDHIEGLPFFAPLRTPGVEVQICGPASTTQSLRKRLLRYLSPPLFPVSLRELVSDVQFYELPSGSIEIGELTVSAQLVIHYNPTVGFRIQGASGTMTYLPDHEPALGVKDFPPQKEWASGYALTEGVDLLIHDAQYTTEEYQTRQGFGHSTIDQAFRFAELAGAAQLVPFHHDPDHNDDFIDKMISQTMTEMQPTFQVTPGKEGTVFDLGVGSYSKA
jgi:phosphoribosyl 1,2-cyclic phosphodiesterase